MTTPRTLVIVNPAAGSGRALRRWAHARRDVPFNYDEVVTDGPGHATRLAAAAAAEGVERILAVGGDGTLHEVVNGVAASPGSSVLVGVVPVGTGNDFARCTGLLQPPGRLLPGLAAGHERTVDLGSVHGQYYLNVAGVGFDAEVARIVNNMSHKGQGTGPYLRTAIVSAFSYPCPRLRLALDDGEPSVAAPHLMVAVGNASAYGGGMRVCPTARVDDGCLDVLSVGQLRGAAVLALLPLVFLGAHLRHPAVTCVRARSLRVEGPEDVALHADGEILGPLPATFTVIPNALNLWVPE